MQLRLDPGLRGIAAGFVVADSVAAGRLPGGFEDILARALERRARPPDAPEEAARLASRDMLRNGRYKPTGRGKPASEYLLRAASEGRFPRIGGPVDIGNLVSLEAMVPVSLWDAERAGAEAYRLRLGRAGESYVFNAAGQEIDLEDLVLVAAVDGDRPIANPVKDSEATKTTLGTRRVAAVVYAPEAAVPVADLAALCERFAALLAGCGASARAAWAIARPGADAARAEP